MGSARVPALFNLVIDWVMEHMCCLGVKGIVVGGHVFTDLDYAEDIALPSASRDELAVSLEHFSRVQVRWISRCHGLRRRFNP